MYMRLPWIVGQAGFFLTAGIWGATLSSAIGSILGAPRILQATSVDRITPGIFAKGYGKTNEPRNALIFTFIIAEAGILIGELNLIARVVSMFFITTYGFLNLSSSLEKWASTDFRPSFKIPAAVSIIGADYLQLNLHQENGVIIKIPYNKISGAIHHKGEAEDRSMHHQFELEIADKYSLQDVRSLVREAVLLSAGARFSREPRVIHKGTEDKKQIYEVTISALSPDYNKLIESNVKEYFK
jgi:hypothetical protein